jgi:hypothetical protein
MASVLSDEHDGLKRLIKNELAELAEVYPFLPRVDADLQYIESAFRDGDEKLEALAPYIASYANLKIRGYQGQVIFIFVFMDITELQHPMQINYAADGSRLIECSRAYTVEYAEQYRQIDVATLWDCHIAWRELHRFISTRSYSKVRTEAMHEFSVVAEHYTLSDDPQFIRGGRPRMKKKLKSVSDASNNPGK